ncbi:MAG: HPF/RaiA family ribosome-associated protein [Candidatus Omnitrophica bacterium]|nr:HPF/RaiA family ribosome-associated protein [Candidatus Omnitrophota bacterium]
MRVDVSVKHFEKTKVLEQTIEKNLKKIERRIKIFKKEAPVHLSLHLEKNPHREEYFSWANIYLPFKVLKSSNKNSSLVKGVNETFSALVKQLDKFKYRLERHLGKKGRKKSPLDEEEAIC